MMSENQKFIDFTRSHPNRNWTSDELVMDSKFAREKENLCLTLIIIPHVLNYSVHMRQCYQLLSRFSKYWNIVKSANQLIVLCNFFFFFFLGWKTSKVGNTDKRVTRTISLIIINAPAKHKTTYYHANHSSSSCRST